MAVYTHRNKRLSRFDLMEQSGAFAKNPANPDSISEDGVPLYKGPLPYPKMMYHPQGEKHEISPGEMALIRGKEVVVGQLFELIYRVVENEEEEAAARAEGWWDTPGESIVAGGGEAPPSSAFDRIKALEAELEKEKRKNASLAAAGAKPVKPGASAAA
jgi:hypothetical protein